jgi:hypothetical protein
MQIHQQFVRRSLECVWLPSQEGLSCVWRDPAAFDLLSSDRQLQAESSSDQLDCGEIQRRVA